MLHFEVVGAHSQFIARTPLYYLPQFQITHRIWIHYSHIMVHSRKRHKLCTTTQTVQQ